MEGKIIFKDERLKESFEELQKYDMMLYEELQKSFSEITRDIYCGRNVIKKLIPKTLVQKYGINNLWIYNLRSGWRLIYSVTNDEVNILALVLDWMNHKDYERLFKF